RFLALLTGRTIEDQYSVEVIDLVLDHSRLEPRRLDQQLLTVLVKSTHADMNRALAFDQPRRQAESSLLHDLLLVPGPLDPRVDQSFDRRLLLDPVDQHPV